MTLTHPGGLPFEQLIFGGHKAVVRPDPFPNSAVKHSLADGSSPIGSARVGCRQFFLKSRDANASRLFYCLWRAGGVVYVLSRCRDSHADEGYETKYGIRWPIRSEPALAALNRSRLHASGEGLM